jgi:hypothetical protein
MTDQEILAGAKENKMEKQYKNLLKKLKAVIHE